jgi:hypothetical protein
VGSLSFDLGRKILFFSITSIEEFTNQKHSIADQ